MSLHDALGEAAHAYKLFFLSHRGNWSTQLHMQEATQLLGENVHFSKGAPLATQEICTISGQSALLLPRIT